MTIELAPENTVRVEDLRHRLLLGIALRDAVTGGTVLGPVVATLESMGPYRLDLPLDSRGPGRHALRYAGLLEARVRAAVKAGADTHAVVRIESPSRMHVPRRVRIELVLDGDAPSFDPPRVNTHALWLWPGAAHPMPPTGTLLRGRVLQGPDLSHGVPVPWARVFATIPETEAVFANASRVGAAQADDRGEFTLPIDAAAFAGAQLPPQVKVRVWAWRPPFVGPPNPADALDGLGVEDAALEPAADPLRDAAPPAAYVTPLSKTLTVRAGETLSGAVPILLYP